MKQIDKHIIERISAGDERAFSSLYDAYYTYLCTIAVYYVFDRSEANEVVNDLFVHLWNHRSELPDHIHTYMIRSVQNRCQNHIRASQTRERVLDQHRQQLLNYQEEFILSNYNPLQNMENAEIEQQIRAVAGQLPPKCRAVFENYFFEGKSIDDIAEEMNISVNTVRVQIQNAISRMRPSLQHLIYMLSVFYIQN